MSVSALTIFVLSECSPSRADKNTFVSQLDKFLSHRHGAQLFFAICSQFSIIERATMDSSNLLENCEKKEQSKRLDLPAEEKEENSNVESGDEKLKFTTKWVEENDFDASSCAGQSSVADESTIYTSSVTESDALSEMATRFGTSVSLDTAEATLIAGSHKIVTLDGEKPVQVSQTEILQHIFKGDSNIQTFDKIQIENSSKVHIGNITYVTGPIHITTDIGSHSRERRNPAESEEKVETKNPDCYIGNKQQRLPNTEPRIVDRRSWLAQPPLEPPTIVTEPFPYVIIAHTATESGYNQAEMVYLVRIVQSFHIESRGWDDIGYNFLIGGDGNVYEGRGWNRVGAHTFGYNRKGLGISFVGCFMKTLPPKVSLDVCKLLIEKGVREGYIAPDYKLFGHCQCIPTESPGKMLYEEIKTWPHYSETFE
ncbi:peptidoglycan-recognition protein LE [Phlebotomus argentipes]|uniref:peptidoglycan-recognition protein LE n=1 Tax=Phlebotomus argentipes TaxID=94469 RepID=UPI002892ACBF|nr:peptidoglycan-recognition protein LE [Phlebotomus argentipes]